MASLSSLKDRLRSGLRRVSSNEGPSLAHSSAQPSPQSGSPERRYPLGLSVFGQPRPLSSDDGRCAAVRWQPEVLLQQFRLA